MSVVEQADFSHKSFDAVLLMALDLPSARLGTLQDQAWRTFLQQTNTAFQVICGLGPARLENALAALAYLRRGSLVALPDGTQTSPPSMESRPTPSRWQWHCDKCSDADCEHRLFTALKRDKQDAAGKPAI